MIGEPVAVEPELELALVAALVEEVLDAADAAALDVLLLDELPHPLAMSAAIPSDSDTAFSLISPLLG
ncbi:MAG TPA: hypothetical protein VMB27_00955 [Solirubrobacteraceae bacterium]|nr:hypothetical protein [Solirubrobacteraceae bacterium]